MIAQEKMQNINLNKKGAYMKTKTIFQMVAIFCFTVVFYVNNIFAALSPDMLFQTVEQAAKSHDFNALKLSLNDLLARNDANGFLKIRAYEMRARLRRSESPELAQKDVNSAIMIARNEIDSYLSGREKLSQEYLIDMCRAYGGAITIGTVLLVEKNMYSEAAALNQSYSEDVLKIGSAFDVDGKKQLIDFAQHRWCDAAETMVKAQNITSAHSIYKNALQIISNLNWTTPEMTEKAIYTMQMGALITSDINDEAFSSAAAEIIEKNKTKSWILYSSFAVKLFINPERQYELYTALIKAQPTNADDNSMALLYSLAYTAAKQTGHPVEAVTYYKILKQKYPDNPLSKNLN
jgi:phage gp36-like protein